MPNIAAVLKDEISRLSRKEIRRQMLPVRKASTAHRKHIAALKREIARLEKLVASSTRRGKAAAAPTTAAPAASESDSGQRFQARGLRSLRARLGLSAAELAKLVGVSAQSVYNWETKKATPRRSQVAQIAQLRGLGKKEVRARLEGGTSETASKGKAKSGRKPRAVAKRAAKPARKVRAKRGRRKAA